MDIEAFDYPLTEAHVARYPVFPQGSSRLLYYDSRSLSHRSFSDITTCLPLRSVLLCNNSEVLPVRLYFSYRGRKVEVFLLSVKGYSDLGMALGLKGEAEVKALVPHSKRLRGCTLRSVKGHRTIFFSYGNEAEDMHRLSWLPAHLSFGEILHAFGHMPLPPYMNREATKEDITHYQGPFAQVPGSVAAPTASFHFTAPLLRALEAAGHMRISFTLHIGVGTFMPIRVMAVEEHILHAEPLSISMDAIVLMEKMLEKERFMVAVGTTALRAVESLYWYGCLLSAKKEAVFDISSHVWQEVAPVRAIESVRRVKQRMLAEGKGVLSGRTRLYIHAPYLCRVARGLITNFHQPKASLLVLLHALIGNEWKRMYREALAKNYRFLSYGDACLLLF